MEPCALCRRAFAAHFVLIAESKVRWRGNSFDAYQAQGRLGLAVAKTLGFDPRSREQFAQFTREVSIRDFREKPGLPQGTFKPEEGETWEFHVGFQNPVPAGTLDAVKHAGAEALRTIANYERVRVAPDADGTPAGPDGT